VADERLVSALQGADRALQLAPLACVLKDLPRPEDLPAQLKTSLAELLLGGEAFSMGGEVALQVAPAQLAPC
jgi:hypothetical protein